MSATSEAVEQRVSSGGSHALIWVGVGSFIYLLLCGVSAIGGGFKWISGGAEGAAAIFAFAGNPLVGVILGTLATALVQSSSTVTSVIVGLVAGGVPVSIAVPMIMGANMGTTITNTIVSLGNLRHRGAFRASFEAATVHDFFNLYAILIFLPIEVLLHPLERSAGWLAQHLVGGGDASVSGFNPIGALTDAPVQLLLTQAARLPDTVGALLVIALGVAMIVGSVLALGRLLQRVMRGRARHIIDRAIGRGPLSGIASGTLVTVLVQSSSTTTSLVVPLAGAGVLSTRQIYPFTLGANIGTCVTALLAATAVAGATAVFALHIALVHLCFNVAAVTLFMLVPWLHHLPLRSSHWLGQRVESHRGWALGYVGGVFFLLPGAVLGAQMLMPGPAPVQAAACNAVTAECP